MNIQIDMEPGHGLSENLQDVQKHISVLTQKKVEPRSSMLPPYFFTIENGGESDIKLLQAAGYDVTVQQE